MTLSTLIKGNNEQAHYSDDYMISIIPGSDSESETDGSETQGRVVYQTAQFAEDVELDVLPRKGTSARRQQAPGLSSVRRVRFASKLIFHHRSQKRAFIFWSTKQSSTAPPPPETPTIASRLRQIPLPSGRCIMQYLKNTVNVIGMVGGFIFLCMSVVLVALVLWRVFLEFWSPSSSDYNSGS
ncbi:hypothetical protein BJY04DRAFT_224378 [Aspergillus karnatakaensis]|uniref:uncharacterized protein n=1 Tax=Aspergillus karnatakaensis TaxID=1810916 RepID=UPI003CCE23FA